MTSLLGTLWGFAKKALNIADCYTLSQNSVVHLNLGLDGPRTFAQPLYISNEIQYVTNLKVNFRVSGVSQYIDTVVAMNELGLTSTVNTTQSVQSVMFTNPTMRQSTIVAIAIIKVQSVNGELRPVNTPGQEISWAQLQDTYTSNQKFAPLVPVFSNSVIWAKVVQLNGPDTFCDIIGGFANSEYPGPVALKENDFIQVIYSASNNFTNPQDGLSGLWARMSGLFSVETVGSNEKVAYEENTQLNAQTSQYKTLRIMS